MNILDKFNNTQIRTLTQNKEFPDFKAGDTVKVGVRISEGKNERVQYFQGLCIARMSKGLHSSFTVRKVSNNEGVERNFPLYSSKLDSIEVLKQGIVRRAKLYYIRELSGKSARIKEKIAAHTHEKSGSNASQKKKASSTKDDATQS